MGTKLCTAYPWHSEAEPVYHTHTACPAGNAVEPKHLRQGTGGKSQCQICKDLEGRPR